MTDDNTDAVDGPEVVYATDPELPGEITTGSGEEYDEPYHDPEWLHMQYHIQKQTQKEMAERAGVHRGTIRKWMKKHDIPRRGKSEAIGMAHGRDPLVWDEEWIRKQYCDNGLSTTEIAELRDVSKPVVLKALDRFGIERRGISESVELARSKEREGSVLEDGDKLRYLYHKRGMSFPQLAEELGWSIGAIRSAFDRHNIPTRSKKAAQLNRSKREKCNPEDSDRELVSADGIDASWRDLKDVNTGCYVPYRDPQWLKKRVEEDLSDAEIAEACDVDVASSTIIRWRENFGIERDNDDQ